MAVGPGRVTQSKKHQLFVATPINKRYEGAVPYLGAAGWPTSAEAISAGKDLRNSYGRRFALKSVIKEF